MASLEKARIYDSVEAFLAHHRHAVQHRHAVTRANAPPLVPEAAGTPPSPFPRADLVPLPASPTPAELEDLCAELNDAPCARRPRRARTRRPGRCARSARRCACTNARVGTKPNPKPAFSFSERKRRASVASALHGNAASILLDARLRDDERFRTRRGARSSTRCSRADATSRRARTADAASVCIDVVADAFDARSERARGGACTARAPRRCARRKRNGERPNVNATPMNVRFDVLTF